ncbi:uncharacterized protein Dana_GF19741 [Drosophila ananassae]|uniref:Uncharacterized protein n=1 Tax=Drosophila ananassae TaxID=7217 RepID=B3N007_DROAN|nr:uncharacterized protein LOC6502487 [Drosophila ananassae]EDV35373.1 uncharacterized protein Dana_GF19741 [Drosophila ananassae]
MAVQVSLLFAFLLLTKSILSDEKIPSKRLIKLNEVITSRINETLLEYSHEDVSSYYKNLEAALKLPITQLDEKIMAYNVFVSKKYKGSYLYEQNVIQLGNESSSRENYTKIEKKLLKLLMKLGIYDDFAVRVFKAIFSDEEQLKKLKIKLDELGEDEINSENDSLWDFIFYLF